VVNQHYAAEKLAFRIRLIGGALRSSQCISVVKQENVDILMKIITSETLINHNEKIARKSVGKLLKDFLKGMLSFYPIQTKPLYGSNMQGAYDENNFVLCTPNCFDSDKVS
jgi:hypothetical protein